MKTNVKMKWPFCVFLLGYGMTLGLRAEAQELPETENIPPSVTDQQELDFYSQGIFLHCNKSPNETRRYSFVTKPSADSNFKIAQTLIDVTAWIHVSGFEEEMESHSGDSVEKTEVDSNQTLLSLNRGGSIAFKRDSATGVLHASMNYDDEKNLQLTCEPTLIICQSVDKTEEKFFFVRMTQPQPGQLLADLTYNFTPEGFSGPVTGHMKLLAQGKASPTSANLTFQGSNGAKGSLKFAWGKSHEFAGKLSFLDPSMKTVISKAPVTCRLGL